MAKLVQLIEAEERRGDGTADDPTRMVRQWWTAEGVLVVQDDPVVEMELTIHRRFLEDLAATRLYRSHLTLRGNMGALKALIAQWEKEGA